MEKHVRRLTDGHEPAQLLISGEPARTDLIEQALSLLPAGTPRFGRLLSQFGLTSYYRTWEAPIALASLAEALEIAERHGETELQRLAHTYHSQV